MVSHSDQCYHPHFSMSSLTTQATVLNNSTHTVVPALSNHRKERPPAVYDHLLCMTTCCIRPPAVYDHIFMHGSLPMFVFTFNRWPPVLCTQRPLNRGRRSTFWPVWVTTNNTRPKWPESNSNLTSYKHVRHICHMALMWSIPNVFRAI